MRALWTPGHTPEHVAYLLIDPELSAEPVALFSGDALFVGEVGRPDLLGPTATQRLAAQLYETVAGRLSKLANDLIVYPGHTAGSPCGKKIGAASRTTIGQEKLTNYAFQARSKQQFIEMVLAGMPKPPTYYPTLKRINQAGPPLLRDLPEGEPLTPKEVEIALDGGALLIDTRTPDAFGSGHIRGAVSVGLDDRFLPWMGWLAPYDRDLVLLLADDEQFEMARTSLRRIGLDRVHGYLAGGIAAWRADGRDLVTLPQITVSDLAEKLAASADPPLVLDVRDEAEWESGHIAGAVHRFAGEIARGAAAPLNGAREIVVICGSGYRSSFAASLLQGRGVPGLRNVAGGMTAWLDAKLPIVTA
ncbi:MAG: MBL fold metallo-hydrolase [Chloroflexia bacterium]|nr:MBL fold metallo-hydrolase [Chloroflexia bacterium]